MEEYSSAPVKTLTKIVLLFTAIFSLFHAHPAKDVIHSPFEQMGHNFKLCSTTLINTVNEATWKIAASFREAIFN